MTACVAGERTTIEVVKWAQGQDDCTAFRANGNIHRDEFRAFIKAKGHLIPKGASLKDQKLHEEVRRLRIRNDKEDDILIEAAPQYEFADQFAAKLQDSIRQVYVNETPALSASQDAVAISIINENAFNTRLVPIIQDYLSSQQAKAIFENRDRNTPETEPSDPPD
jgi:hypothetical protein